MRIHPDSNEDYQGLKNMNAEAWMAMLLKKNPEYVFWGCYEDYMADKNSGWREAVIVESWSEFGHWELDELNELVNFYFEIYRPSKKCTHCDETGYNPATKKIADNFYDFDGRGNRWVDKITEDEVEALVKHSRLREFIEEGPYHFNKEKEQWEVLYQGEWIVCEKPKMPSAEDVNKVNMRGSRGMNGHDGINRCILIRARAERLGVHGHCEHCDGKGYVYTEPKAKVALQLWYILPRKGCSRGVYIKSIKSGEVKDIINYLKEAAKRNQKRFSKL